MRNENNTSVKKYIVLAVTAIFAMGLLCACGGTSEESESESAEASKATITAGEAAEKEALDKANDDIQTADGSASKQRKTGTEDGAIDAAKKAAYEDIEDFDGKWQNLSVDVDDPITIIDFDWDGNHYKYEFNQETGQIKK